MLRSVPFWNLGAEYAARAYPYPTGKGASVAVLYSSRASRSRHTYLGAPEDSLIGQTIPSKPQNKYKTPIRQYTSLIYFQ